MFHLRTKGFTLIELLVVIAIIGILASVVLASLNSARMKSRDAARISQLKEVQKSLELYYLNNGSYPVVNGGSCPTCLDGITDAIVGGGYMSVIPVDPTQGNGANGYRYAAVPAGYTLMVDFEGITQPRWCRMNGGTGFAGWQNELPITDADCQY